MLRKLIPVMATMFVGASLASADVLFDNRGTVGLAGGVAIANSTSPLGTAQGAIFTNFLEGSPETMYRGILEDGTFAGGAGGYNITGINLGYYNASTSSTGFDALVTFYDTVDYTVPDPSVVTSGPVGSTYRLHITAPAGKDGGGFLTFGETGVISLPGGPLSFPDNTFGVSVRYVDTNTTTPSTVAHYIFRNVPVTVGTSDGFFAEDADNSNTYVGAEILTWAFDPYPDANLYLQIDGSPVPEPASLGLIALGGMALVKRRR